ncbi:MAG: cell division topological specificity factor MinE [Candidatus Eremiobacteraeota bacterium]|nr:cell division topological specificity factor MinE [Candidatus Eremiobacteraeota bacterium]
MLNFLKSLFMPPPPSGALAKERLRLVLLSDHLSLAPDVVENLKRDLLEVISRYVEIDTENADVTFEHREREVAMLASIPITGVRERGTPEASRLEARPSSDDVDAGDDVQTSVVPETVRVVDAAEESDAGDAGTSAENHVPSVVPDFGAAEAAEAPLASPSSDEKPLQEGLGAADALPARAPSVEAASPSSALAVQPRPAQRRRRRKKRAPIVVQSLGTPAQA